MGAVNAGWDTSRREVLRWGVLAVLAAPLAACAEGYDDSPDPLSALASAARADAKDARRLSSPVAKEVARVRSAHADALHREAVRANRPAATPKAGDPVTDLGSLGKRLDMAMKQARAQLPAASRHRAGLLGSVIAGCAGVQTLDRELGGAPVTDFAAASPGELQEETVAALQQALDTEHAAVWVYGLVSAFLPGEFAKGLDDGAGEHQQRRDAAQTMIAAAGAAPALAEAAYLPPKPVKDEKSAKAVVITAESDAATAWRAVIERCDDASLRSFSVDAMAASAARGTRWRSEAGLSPAAVALPGDSSPS